MRIYADPSFLISWLYRGDAHHAAARRVFARHSGDDWLTSDWSRFETINSVRQLCLGGFRPEGAEALVRFFKHLHRAGPFAEVETDPAEAAWQCQQLSAGHATRLRMRAADVLHVALLEQILPDRFVTRDRDQHALATAMGIRSTLV